MFAQQNRALLHAVLLSLAVHAFFLFGQLPSVRRAFDAAAPSAPLVARIEPEAEKPAPEKLEREKKPEPPRPAPALKPREPQGEKPAPAAAPPEQPLPAPPAAPPAAASAPAARSASAHARAAPTEGVAAQTIAQYRLQVIGAAAAFNRYPPLARENNWEGAVEVRMRVRGDGGGAELSVRKGSGHEVLDEQALEMFRKAQERVPLPGALRGRDFSIELKAIYRLKDAEEPR